MKVVFDDIFLMKLTTFILILMNPHLTLLWCFHVAIEKPIFARI